MRRGLFLFLSLTCFLGCPSSPAVSVSQEPVAAAPEPPAREPVLIVPVPDKAAEGSQRYDADWSFDIRDEEHFSVHVHVIPPGQMVPLHQHPDNWELSFVAAGLARWSSVAVVDGIPQRVDGSLEAGQGFIAPAGAFHEVRNRGAETLAVVVVHQPSFGQNWYLPEAEVLSNIKATPLATESAGPEGWAVAWADGSEVTAKGDRVLLITESGTLRFEDKTVPVGAGTVASFPPGLAHSLDGRALSIEIPRP